MIIAGRLLIDPHRAPEPGWIRTDAGRIAEIGFGERPASDGPPDHGARDRLITPAFYDAHTHIPQFESVGCDGLPLLDWLQRVIYPAEAWWGRGGALPAARTAARRLVTQGTAGIAAYLTSHAGPSREALGYLATSTPLRFIAGRVAMDRLAPDELTAEDRDRASQRPVRPPVLAPLGDDPRHQVSANPRFAIACTPELLAEIGWHIRDNPGTWVQTHLAESPDECASIRSLYPDDPSYTAVYDRFGLLTPRTLLAHAIHLGPDEWRLIAERGSIAVHCPTANTFLESGWFDLDAARTHAVNVALGTDVAAGADVAMPRVARAMIEVAKHRRIAARAGGRAAVHIPTPAEAWRMITSGNADLLGWGDAGRLEAGAAADLLVLRPPLSWYDEHLVGRLLYNWSSDLIEARIMNGLHIIPHAF